MGCPIRKSTDQRVFAPPRSLSQRITSFIACACQGIHQMPLRHLIVLITNIHSRFVCFSLSCAKQSAKQTKYQQKRPASRDIFNGAVKLPIISKGFEHSLATHVSFSKLRFPLRKKGFSFKIFFQICFPKPFFDNKHFPKKVFFLTKNLYLRRNLKKGTCLNISSLHNFNRTSKRSLDLLLNRVLTT